MATVSTPRSQTRVFDLPVHRASRWMFNCYILEGAGDGVVFVDPGLPSTAQASLDLLRTLGRDPAKGSCTVSTHGHSDHVGGIPLLREQIDPQIYLPGRCAGYLNGEQPRSFGTDASIRFLPMSSQQPFDLRALKEFGQGGRAIGFGLKGDFKFPCEPSGFLHEGSRVPGAPGWEVIDTPGHSDESVCFYHRDSATLLSGDSVLTLDGRPWFNPEWVDVADSEATEERLRSLEVEHLLPGHGLPISGDVWRNARSFRDKPDGKGVLARCARRFGKWDY